MIRRAPVVFSSAILDQERVKTNGDGTDGNKGNAGDCGRAWSDAGGVRAYPENIGGRSEHHGAGNFQRDVERALLLQVEQSASKAPANAREVGGARAGRERGRGRHR